VQFILMNPAYTGDYAGGRESFGKYNTLEGEKVVKGKRRRRKPEGEWIIRSDRHEAIIDRPTFEKAQKILTDDKLARGPFAPEDNPYYLSCLMRCGRCGAVMTGKTKRRKNKRKPDRLRRYYECGVKNYHGKNSPCPGTTVSEEEILHSLADRLDNWLGDDADALGIFAMHNWLKEEDIPTLPPLFHQLRQMLFPPARPKQDRRRLEKQLTQVKAKLERARGNPHPLVHSQPCRDRYTTEGIHHELTIEAQRHREEKTRRPEWYLVPQP
jgi:hypothetical protein